MSEMNLYFPRIPGGSLVRSMSRYVLAVCVLLLVPLLSVAGPGTLAGQERTLTVRVTGEEGSVSGATVEVAHRGEVRHRAPTDDEGIAVIRGVPADPFEVRVQALGFRSRVMESVVMGPEGTRVLEVRLESVPIEMEGITVRAERVQIQRENTEFTTRVDEVAIQLLPMAHDVSQLVALTPGARPGHVWGGANFQANNYRVDGLSANHPGLGGDLLQPSINWIERVEVRGLGAGAAFGGFQGGLIDVFTKRGTNLFQGSVRSSVEHNALNNTNLVSTEIGTEVAARYDVEGEVRGPIVRDRLFYYLSGRRVLQDRRALNHLTVVEGRHSPVLEERTETKAFGKLTWMPLPRRTLELSGAYTDTRADNFGMTGYEAPGAAHRYTAPIWFLNASWQEVLGSWGVLEGRVNRFSRDERHDPYGGEDLPGIRTWSVTPPFTAFGNNPFTLRSAPSSTSGTAQGTFRVRTGGLEHMLNVGAEYTRGSFLDRRIRNGGMTWLPMNVRTSQYRFDPVNPATWSLPSVSFVPSQWGGEVWLDADVARAAVFAQTALSLGPRVVLSPGVRWNRWQGWLSPRDGDRFLAVRAGGWDPRIGLLVDITSDGMFVAKAHWGRYHQDMISQMFDRVAGGDVFTNEEIWYFRGDRFTDPYTRFTLEERDALGAQGLFTRESVVTLNETGPALDYRQPYIDQWLVALEKQFSGFVKMEALYTRRSNKNMVALVDRNRDVNYTRFTQVRVYDEAGQVLPYGGGSVFLREVYLPNHLLLERLRCMAAGDCPDAPPIPGFTAADTLNLVWLGPDHVLTTAPDARREFSQFQVNVEVARPTWGASFSFAVTDLEGNLDNVSGYTDPDNYGPGPYVRVNEGVNAFGKLENYAERELKVSAWGELFWKLRAGAFWTARSGDHYSPQFRLSGQGTYQYRVGTGALIRGPSGFGYTSSPGQILDHRFFWPLEGHWIFVGPRGAPQVRRRANLDLRVDRMLHLRGYDLAFAVDLFNVTDEQSITRLNTMVNNGPSFWQERQTSTFGRTPSNQYYQAPQERVPPRSLRLGLTLYF
jgi:hypothetical protein